MTDKKAKVDEPLMPKCPTGVYARCVWCRGELYMPSVIAYSAGELSCTASPSCERYIPADYIVEEDDE